MYVQPAAPKSFLTQTALGLEIRFPPNRNLFQVAFAGAWLVMWTVGGISAIDSLTHTAKFAVEQLFLLAWLRCWALAEIFVVWFIAWSLAGEELLIVGAQELSLRRSILSIGLTREYDLSVVLNLRVSVQPAGRSGFSRCLAFDYGAKTIEFANGIDEAEAFMVVRQLSTAYPSLKHAALS